jgi:O-antigen/teichoic acid export membrane protein
LRSTIFNRLFRADSVAVSLGASAGATVISRAIGLVRGVALAWLIPQEQFGLLGVALLVANVLMPACSAGLYEGAARYAPFHESAGTLRRFIVRVSLLVAGVTLVTAGILAVFAGPVGSLLFSAGRLASGTLGSAGSDAYSIPLTRSVLACVLTLACYQTLLGLLKGLRMFRAVGAAELFSAVTFTLAAIIGAGVGYATAQAVMWAYALSCALSVLVFAPGVFAQSGAVLLEPAERPGGKPSSLVRYSLWAAGTAIMWHTLSYYPMWYLLKVSDSATVGTFHAMRIMTQLIQIGAVMLTAVVAAEVNRMWEQEGREPAVWRLELLTKSGLVSLLAGATVLLLARPLLMRAFPDAFAGGASAFDPLVLFFLLVGVVGLVAIRLNLVEKPRSVFVAWLVGAAVNVAASFALLGSAVGSPAALGESALQAAAWAGVAGVTASLAVCLALAAREGVGLRWRAVALGIVGYAAGLGWPVIVPVLVVILAAALTTELVFSTQERLQLRSSIARLMGR